MNRHVSFFHAPNSRSESVHLLLEELGASYDLHLLDLKAGQQREPGYLAVNPMGKVPAILHGEALVTEQAAVFIYLADLYPAAALAPAIGDPLRGPYLRWMVFYGSCVEPAITDRMLERAPASPSICPYGDYDTMLAAVSGQLSRGPYMLGERFSALDILWGTALGWITAFKLMPETPEIAAYIARVSARPAAIRVREKDAALAAAQGK